MLRKLPYLKRCNLLESAECLCIGLLNFEETGVIDDRPRSGRPPTARTPQAIKVVEARTRRYPLRKQKIIKAVEARICRSPPGKQKVISREMQISSSHNNRRLEFRGLKRHKEH